MLVKNIFFFIVLSIFLYCVVHISFILNIHFKKIGFCLSWCYGWFCVCLCFVLIGETGILLGMRLETKVSSFYEKFDTPIFPYLI